MEKISIDFPTVHFGRSRWTELLVDIRTPWKNGTTHVEFEPIDFIAKLAALVPPPGPTSPGLGRTPAKATPSGP
jgi:hypothetical protein